MRPNAQSEVWPAVVPLLMPLGVLLREDFRQRWLKKRFTLTHLQLLQAIPKMSGLCPAGSLSEPWVFISSISHQYEPQSLRLLKQWPLTLLLWKPTAQGSLNPLWGILHSLFGCSMLEHIARGWSESKEWRFYKTQGSAKAWGKRKKDAASIFTAVLLDACKRTGGCPLPMGTAFW